MAISATRGRHYPAALAGTGNVAFQQMTGLVQLLRRRDVCYELIVFPDDVHESPLHRLVFGPARWSFRILKRNGYPPH